MVYSEEKIFNITKLVYNEIQISFRLNLLEKFLIYEGKNGFKFALKDITIFPLYKASKAYYKSGFINLTKVYRPAVSQVQIITADIS